MTKRLQLHQGGWWRFDRYEIIDGYIRPAKGARLQEYDPWDQFRKSKVDSTVQPPYRDLLNLLTDVGLDYKHSHWDVCEFVQISKTRARCIRRAGVAYAPAEESPGRLGWELLPDDELNYYRRFPLSADKECLIADWCSRYGLLGVLSHICDHVTTALLNRRRGRGPFIKDSEFDEVTFYRTNGQWHEHSTEIHHARAFGKVTRDVIIENAQAKILDVQYYADPSAPAGDSLLNTWGHYFPVIPRRQRVAFPYPRPLTPEFWAIYAEPVPIFLRYALMLHQAIEPLSKNSPFSKIIPRDASLAALDALTAPTGKSTVAFDDALIEHRWICPSLLSIFAEMGVEDLSSGRFVGRCACCGGPYVSSAYQARYCSQQCAWRHRKRRERDKDEQADQP